VIVGPALEAEAQVRSFKAKHKIEFPLLSDAQAAAKSYLVTGYPMMFVVGKDRKIVWQGHFKDAKFEPAIEAALKAAAPTADAKADAKPEAKETPAAAPNLTVYVLKNGTKITAKTVMEAGDEYVIKDENGKMSTVSKDDVIEIKK
jgi:hypothetical protein